MRCKSLLIVLFISSFIFSRGNVSCAEGWKEYKGDHFIVYSIAEDSFAKDVLSKSEYYYSSIATNLGYARYNEFWLWDKRVKIYIYPDHASYLKATGEPEWSQGVADYTTKDIKSYVWSKSFLESLLPHEIAHLIFRDFVGFKGEVPLWLDEGVAQWEEEQKRPQMKRLIKDAYEKDALLSIESMMKIDLKVIKDNSQNNVYLHAATTREGKPGVLFLSGTNLINTYYLQSVALVGFLIEKYGSDSFAKFCRELRDGKSVEEALKFIYPNYIHSLAEFQERWRDYLATL